MKEEVGLWIDHYKTVIIGDGEGTVTLKSNVKKHVRFTGGARGKTAYSSNYFPAEDHVDRQFVEHLNKYYSDVITHLRDARRIIIMGPGEAKFELEKRMQHEGLKEHVIRVETADKLTERQISARIKNFFASFRL
jgi:hypothetical protein